MLARLILALLLAAFAVPVAAPAACHDAPVGRAHAMPMGHASDTAPEKAMPSHGCIGCVPPSNWIGARGIGAPPRECAPLIARARVLDIGTGAPPALPPPRTV